MTERGDGRPYVVDSRGVRTLHFAAGTIQSRMRLDAPDALDLDYTRTMMGFLLFQPDPRRIAMVGLGGGSLVKFCHRHLPQARIAVVEIDPQVIALRAAFLLPPDGPRLQVLQGDGAQFVRSPAARGEVLLVDGFDRDGMPDRLASQRFCDDCAGALQPGGVLVLNLRLGDPRQPLLLDRLRRSFGGAVLVAGDGAMDNRIVFACQGPPLSAYRPGLLRLPDDLDAADGDSLRASVAPVVRALAAQRAAAPG